MPDICGCCGEKPPTHIWGDGGLCGECYEDMQAIDMLRDDLLSYLKPLITTWAEAQKVRGYGEDLIWSAFLEVKDLLER